MKTASQPALPKEGFSLSLLPQGSYFNFTIKSWLSQVVRRLIYIRDAQDFNLR
jgi:hypothetical protein